MVCCCGRLHVQWGNLSRCFNKQLAVNTPMCHECQAGTELEVTTLPLLKRSTLPTVAHIPFEKGGDDPSRVPDERIFRRDIFHNSKMGTLRDFMGSVVLVLCRLKYFNVDDELTCTSNCSARQRTDVHPCRHLHRCFSTRPPGRLSHGSIARDQIVPTS